eukprot:scaffold1878_cov258-Pinguiococcus_pyrenoidosus.AAC.26
MPKVPAASSAFKKMDGSTVAMPTGGTKIALNRPARVKLNPLASLPESFNQAVHEADEGRDDCKLREHRDEWPAAQAIQGVRRRLTRPSSGCEDGRIPHDEHGGGDRRSVDDGLSHSFGVSQLRTDDRHDVVEDQRNEHHGKRVGQLTPIRHGEVRRVGVGRDCRQQSKERGNHEAHGDVVQGLHSSRSGDEQGTAEEQREHGRFEAGQTVGERQSLSPRRAVCDQQSVVNEHIRRSGDATP